MEYFKKGDRVMCVTAPNYGALTVGREYVILQDQISDVSVHVISDNGVDWGYYPNRFKFIPEISVTSFNWVDKSVAIGSEKISFERLENIYNFIKSNR